MSKKKAKGKPAKKGKEAPKAKAEAALRSGENSTAPQSETDAAGSAASGENGLPDEKSAQKVLLGDRRAHVESLGAAWIAVSGLSPDVLIPQVAGTVIKEGMTREPWKWEDAGLEYIFMAWPKVSGIRAGMLFRGKKGGHLDPMSAVPLLEGVPNQLTVEKVHPWEEGCGANVGCNVLGPEQPMWFYDPFYVRDRTDLTEGVTQPILLAGLAFGVRKALLDEITITKGPAYEEYAAQWLADNPGKGRLDVPPLKINVSGRHLIHPGNSFGEYQIRAVVQDIDDAMLDTMPFKILYTEFPVSDSASLRIPIYVAKINMKSFEPKVGDEFDAYVWLQGRVSDWNGAEATVDPNEDASSDEQSSATEESAGAASDNESASTSGESSPPHHSSSAPRE